MATNGFDIATEPMTAYGSRSYADVMMMFYSMPITIDVKQRVSQRLVQEVKGENLSRAINSINRLSALKDDWDGFGASHILSAVISNIRAVLLLSNDDDWADWTMSPNTNGTIFLQSAKYISSLSLGCEEYSYFTKKDGIRNGKSHLPFDAKNFLSAMRSLNA
jgi:hypothetical protein